MLDISVPNITANTNYLLWREILELSVVLKRHYYSNGSLLVLIKLRYRWFHGAEAFDTGNKETQSTLKSS